MAKYLLNVQGNYFKYYFPDTRCSGKGAGGKEMRDGQGHTGNPTSVNHGGFLIEILLICNVVLVSGVQRSASVTHIRTDICSLSLIGCNKILSIQQVLAGYLFYIQ